jgi:hypothetical protein
MTTPQTVPTEPARPLTVEEKKILNELMSRENAFTGPAQRVGEPYMALTNLSVPRRGDPNRQCDLVTAGNTVYLTEAEALAFNRKDTHAGRQVDVVRKLTGPGGTREEAPRLLPRQQSGRLFRPPLLPGTDAARPDPAESSAIQILTEEGRAPETEGAMTADPSEMADHLRESVPDAVDLPPRRTRARGANA